MLINRGFWLDEAYVAINTQAQSFSRLAQGVPFDAFLPIPPPGFNLVVKAVVTMLGHDEWIYRLFPFAAACVSLPLFFYFVRKFLKDTAAVLATAFFAVNPLLIYYAAELKPYSTDVLWSLILFCTALRFCGSVPGRKEQLFLLLLGPTAFYFSHTAAFVLISVGLAWIAGPLMRREKRELRAYGIVLAGWAAAVFVQYLISYRHMHASDMIIKGSEHAWVPAFSFSAAAWLADRLIWIFSETSGIPGWIILPVFLVGAAGTLKERKGAGLVLVLPFFVMLAASLLHKYPLFPRLTLFYIPALIILFVKGIEIIVKQCPGKGAWTAAAAAFFLIFPVQGAWTQMREGYRAEDIRPVVRHLKEHFQEGDRIYVNEMGLPAFKYYAGRYGLAHGRLRIRRLGDQVYHKGSRKGMEIVDEELAYAGPVYDGSVLGGVQKIMMEDPGAFAAHPRSWFVFSHYGESRDFVLEWIGSNGRMTREFKEGAAEAYLADLTHEK